MVRDFEGLLTLHIGGSVTTCLQIAHQDCTTSCVSAVRSSNAQIRSWFDMFWHVGLWHSVSRPGSC